MPTCDSAMRPNQPPSSSSRRLRSTQGGVAPAETSSGTTSIQALSVQRWVTSSSKVTGASPRVAVAGRSHRRGMLPPY